MRAIGIFGGTFDPIHDGHLRSALEIHERLGLDQIRFVPNARPAHREQPVLSSEKRVALLELAIREQPGFQIDLREMLRPATSYTVHTLRQLREELGQQPICLILGMDAFLGLPSWHKWEELLTLAHIIVAHRPGASLPESGVIGALLKQHRTKDNTLLHNQSGGYIYVQTVTPLDISATRIRAIVADGGSARFLMPEPVWEHIQQEGLYRHAI